MSRRCCCGDCIIFSDNFTRGSCADAPVATIGNDWTVDVVGTWTLRAGDPGGNSDCVLHENGNFGARIINLTETRSEAMVISVHLGDTINTPASGTIYRIFVNYKSAIAFYFIEISENSFTFRDSGGGQIGRTEPTGWGGDPEDDSQWLICLSEAGVWTAGPSFGENNPAHRCIAIIEGGKKSGLGNGGSVAMVVDTFEISEHKDRLFKCPNCCCRECDQNCVPDSLTVFVTSEDCCVGGLQFGLVVDALCEEADNQLFWRVANPGPIGCWAPGCAFEGAEWEFTIVCDDPNASPGWMGWKLLADPDMDEHCGDPTVLHTPIDGTCDPFYLKFVFPEFGDQGGGGDVCDNPEDVGLVTFEVME